MDWFRAEQAGDARHRTTIVHFETEPRQVSSFMHSRLNSSAAKLLDGSYRFSPPINDMNSESTRVMLERAVRISPLHLAGDLVVPKGALGVVLFAHGSGSSRHSSRNRYVARVLQQGGLATLLMDLLTSEEEQVDMRTAHLRFDIPLLAGRLVEATDWLANEPETRELSTGYFGASTGGGAALVAAAARPAAVGAVVSHGGRPDLAGESLPLVKAPTLLIVRGRDEVVIELNERAKAQLRTETGLEIVTGATHFFEEPGTLERVADLAQSWFERHLPRRFKDNHLRVRSRGQWNRNE